MLTHLHELRMADEAEEGAEAETKDEHRRLRVREASAPP